MSGKGLAAVNYGECMACGSCVQFCPFGYLELGKTGLDDFKKEYPRLVDGHRCTGCGICAEHCTVECIEMA